LNKNLKFKIKNLIYLALFIALTGCGQIGEYQSAQSESVPAMEERAERLEDKHDDSVAKISHSDNNRTIEQLNNEIIFKFNFGNDTLITNYHLPFTNTSVWQAMQSVLVENDVFLDYQTYGELGVFITQIGEKKNGQDGKYWQYFINDQYAQVGASNYILKPGDIVEWKFTNERL